LGDVDLTSHGIDGDQTTRNLQDLQYYSGVKESRDSFNGRGILDGRMQKVTHDMFRQVRQPSHIPLHPCA
jgi:hypothetical protein